MAESNRHIVNVQDTEILSTTVGKFHGEVRGIITLRPEPSHSFESLNLSVSLRTLWRLRENLNALFQNSEMIIRELSSDMLAEEEGAREGYDRLVAQGQNKKRRRKKE